MTKRAFMMIVLSAIGMWLSMELDHIWWERVMSGASYNEPYGISLVSVIGWIPSLFVFICLGAVLAKLAEPSASIWWAVGLGVLGSTFWFFATQFVFPADPALVDIVWAYSPGIVPILASVIGWWMLRRANTAPHPTPKNGAAGL